MSVSWDQTPDYSDALKHSILLRTIPHWNSLAPSVVAAERPHPRATRQHKIPWCGLAVVIIMEKPY